MSGDAPTLNIAAAVERGACRHPARNAIVFEDERWSYAALEGQASRAAGGLWDLGVRGGDRVAIHLPNIPAFIWSYLGALKLGSIAVSLNAGLTPPEVQALVADSGASVLITTRAFAASFEAARRTIPALRHVLAVDGTEAGALGARPAAAPSTWPCAAVTASTPAAIVYTSGTTGTPRGAVLSHGNVRFVMAAKQRYMGVRAADRLLLFLPLFHCFGQNAIMNAAFAAGATLVLHRAFEAGRILRSIREDRVSMVFGVPTTFVVLLDAASPQDLAGVRYFFSAAATLPVEIERRWQDRFMAPIHQGYGLSETGPFASYNHLTAHRQGSIGVPIDGVEMRVVDVRDGAPLPPGTPGEIVVRGPNVMLGYWNRPADTAAVMRDGWFRTGDIGRMDASGYFFIEDRLKDMVIVGGFNVYPAEIENVLYEHPAVREVAVHGVPDPVLGERVRAVVALKSDAAASAADLTAFCRPRLAPLKVPAEIAFVEALPRNRSGKVLKRVLRDEYVPPAAAAAAPLDVAALGARIAAWLSVRLETPVGADDAHTPFLELGLTSILAVELAAEIAAWTRRDVLPTVTWSFSTIAALAAHVLGASLSAAGDRDPVRARSEAEIAALSEAEAEALLREELDRLGEGPA